MNTHDIERDPWGDWAERQGSCLPSPIVAEEAEVPAAMVCAVAVGCFVLGAACFIRWAVMS